MILTAEEKAVLDSADIQKISALLNRKNDKDFLDACLSYETAKLTRRM